MLKQRNPKTAIKIAIGMTVMNVIKERIKTVGDDYDDEEK